MPMPMPMPRSKAVISSALLKRTLLTIAILIALFVGARASTASAEDLISLYPDFWKIQQPGRFDLFGFGGGYVSDQYGTVQEGFQMEQSVAKYIGLFGRVTGYELWLGEGFDSPLDPGKGHRARLNFGRAQGGVDF